MAQHVEDERMTVTREPNDRDINDRDINDRGFNDFRARKMPSTIRRNPVVTL